MGGVFKCRSGAGIVSVVVAFAVMLTIAASFYQAARMSARLIAKAEYTNAEVMAVVESYYYGNSTPGAQQEIGFTDRDGSPAFRLTTNVTAYSEPGVSDGIKIYYFGE